MFSTSVPQFRAVWGDFQIATPKNIGNLTDWVGEFWRFSVFIELLVLLVCILLCWGIVRLCRHFVEKKQESKLLARVALRSFWFGRKDLDGLFFPLLLFIFVFVARGIIALNFPSFLLTLVLSVLLVLSGLRVIVSVLLRAFPEAKWAMFLEHLVGWGAWIGGLLWGVGLLPAVWQELDGLTWKMGSSTVSVAMLLQGLAVTVMVIILMLWVSNLVEERLLKGNPMGSELSLRKAISNATRAILILIGVLLAFSSVGIDLTALSVLGGAVGVGIGLGLQRIASSYVSGFVILTESSMRIGDVVKVNGFEGKITQINTRYTVIRSANGRENIIPNDVLITNAVENATLSDSLIQISLPLNVTYAADPLVVREIMKEAAVNHPLVVTQPAPSVDLSSLEDFGMRFTLYYWFQAGKGNSSPTPDLNLTIMHAFKKRKIEIARPQSVVQLVSATI